MKGGKKGRDRQHGSGGNKVKASGPGSAKARKAMQKFTQPRKPGERVKSYGWRSSTEDQ